MKEKKKPQTPVFSVSREMNLTIDTVTFESCTAFMQKHRTFIKEEETGKNRLEQSGEKEGDERKCMGK